MTAIDNLFAQGVGRTWPDADPTDLFYCHAPTLVSFSGGRTSAYMLWRVLCAHGGVLPEYVFVVFANTGKEREETLRFVYECGVRWGVPIWWLEWLARPTGRAGRAVAAEDRFALVGFNSASRNGEPFNALVRRKGYLPNAVTRFCTAELKIAVMTWFMQSRGFTTWTNMVGLRADERKRVMKQVMRSMSGKEAWISYCPLALAGIVKRIVMKFWLGRNRDPRKIEYYLPQGFDLGLRDYEGNCDGCFLKGFDVLCHQERERPGTGDWWREAEAEVTAIAAKSTGAQFVTEYSWAEIQRIAASTPELVDWESLPSIGDCTAGACGVDPHDTEPDPDDAAMAWLYDQMLKMMESPLQYAAREIVEPALGDLFDGEAA